MQLTWPAEMVDDSKTLFTHIQAAHVLKDRAGVLSPNQAMRTYTIVINNDFLSVSRETREVEEAEFVLSVLWRYPGLERTHIWGKVMRRLTPPWNISL